MGPSDTDFSPETSDDNVLLASGEIVAGSFIVPRLHVAHTINDLLSFEDVEKLGRDVSREDLSLDGKINTEGTRKISVTCVIDEKRFINVGNSKSHLRLVVDEDDDIDSGEEAMISPR